MKVVTFGSCLSRYSVNALQARSGVQLLGAVYHNRIDRFVDHYVDRISDEPSTELIAKMVLSEGGAGRCNLMLDNQLTTRKLGHHAIHNQLGFMKALDGELDLIVLDNFVDLVAKLAAPKGSNPSLFLTFSDCTNINELFDIEKNYLDIDLAIEKWHKLIAWIKKKQPNTPIAFFNFPLHHHTNTLMQERSKAFAEWFQNDDCFIVPDCPVHPSLIDTPSHFRTMQYSMYAGIIEMVVKNRAYIESKTVNDADSVLRAGIKA
jgi:hypothetical protein